MRDGKTNSARAKSGSILLDRGWGKPAQTVNANTDDKRHATDWSRGRTGRVPQRVDMKAYEGTQLSRGVINVECQGELGRVLIKASAKPLQGVSGFTPEKRTLRQRMWRVRFVPQTDVEEENPARLTFK